MVLATTVFLVMMGPGFAMPMTPTDESKVPHYFGPYPNWALSPITGSNATVEITGDGSGATATATVDPVTGAIASIDVTSPGHGYTIASVVITGGDGTASATATLSTSGVVTGFTNIVAGGGYKAFNVALTGGGGTGATAAASGGVDVVTVSDGGAGYTMPTVDFDLPDDPNGVQATGHVATQTPDGFDGMDANGTILPNGVVVDNPGSGYSTAPGVTISTGPCSTRLPGRLRRPLRRP